MEFGGVLVCRAEVLTRHLVAHWLRGLWCCRDLGLRALQESSLRQNPFSASKFQNALSVLGPSQYWGIVFEALLKSLHGPT